MSKQIFWLLTLLFVLSGADEKTRQEQLEKLLKQAEISQKNKEAMEMKEKSMEAISVSTSNSNKRMKTSDETMVYKPAKKSTDDQAKPTVVQQADSTIQSIEEKIVSSVQEKAKAAVEEQLKSKIMSSVHEKARAVVEEQLKSMAQITSDAMVSNVSYHNPTVSQCTDDFKGKAPTGNPKEIF